MLLILYDAQKEVAYFEDLQVYFQKNRLNFGKGHKFVRIFYPNGKYFNSSCYQ